MASVTIYDIAKEARVSPATVSRVLTGNARVKPSKEKEIRNLMEQYNFYPNAMAQSLIAGRSRLIGLITADIRNPYYAELCVACEVAAKNMDYRVLLCNVFDDNAVEEDCLEIFAAQRVDAVIQLGCRVDALAGDSDYIQRINRLAVPFISTGKLEGSKAYSYGVNQAEGLRIAFEHLHALGHERIALLGGRLNVRPTYEKWTKYIYLLGIHGLPLRPGYVQEGSYDFFGGVECMNRLLALEEPPTAVITINDYVAMGALSAINAKGLNCPADVSIISHDNTFLAKTTTPLLTSVDCCYEQLGEGLVSTAMKLIDGEENVPNEVCLTPALSHGGSCSSPPV